ncbi:MAG: glycogen synthase GlgA [Desulfomonilaceae bacterium]|nr:glycogen synthase GlgA [Desulfomonilaceae bacterium]
MRILMITPEATPFAKTGGLGEVLAALPEALVDLGAEVDVLLPKYREITPDAYGIEKTEHSFTLTLNAKEVSAGIWELRKKGGPRYLFLECDQYYDRENLYGTSEGDYEDNAERFVFLTRAAIEMALKAGIKYDVYQSHDWQAALAPVYLRTLYAGEPLLEAGASIITIHNLGYQGIFWHLDMPLVGVGWEFFTPKYMEFHGKLNFLKSGIVFAEEVNTVSPGYCKEILTPAFGFGLEGVLQEKGSHLTGIINGVDYKVWNPETDPRIAARFSPSDLSGKSRCKVELQEIAQLPLKPDAPLIGMVSRLSSQKGIDIFEGALESLLERDLQFVLLGTGDARYHDKFDKIAKEVPDKTGIFLTYDDELAHKIFAGADMLLVPSRYEPCGLNQLYALKYGAVPVVRSTGGLADTVEEYDPDRDSGTGFKFVEQYPSALERTILKAADLYRNNPDVWNRLMIRGMTRDFSWNRSAKEYMRLYEKAVEGRKRSRLR